MSTGGLYSVVRTERDVVVVRVARACTALELCAALGLSKAVQARVFAHGALTCEGARLGRNAAIPAGGEVVLALAPAGELGPVSSEPVHVLYQDRFVLAAEKPAGLLVHGDGTGADTLTARVRGCTGLAAQAVQRLDVDTSGVVLFSLAAEFQSAFDALVAGHELHKRYLAIVRGHLPEGVRVIDAPIARDRHDARRMRVGATGKPAQTVVVPVACDGQHTLVACELRTGRRHQIRVHLAHAGCPIVGDVLYGAGRVALPKGTVPKGAQPAPLGTVPLGSAKPPGTVPLGSAKPPGTVPLGSRCPQRQGASLGQRNAKRGLSHFGERSEPKGTVPFGIAGLMLHAHELAFVHPVTGERVVARTEWPLRFAELFSPRAIDWSILETPSASQNGSQTGTVPFWRTGKPKGTVPFGAQASQKGLSPLAHR